MESSSWWSVVQYAIFLAVVVLLVKPVGAYLTQVFNGQPTFLDFLFRPIERLIYKITRVDAGVEMNWREYAISFVTFSFVGTFALFLILKMRAILPFFFRRANFRPRRNFDCRRLKFFSPANRAECRAFINAVINIERL